MESTVPTTWVFEGNGIPGFRASRRTVVTTLEVLHGDSSLYGPYCLWASVRPSKAQLSPDGTYTDSLPFVLASGEFRISDLVTQFLIQRWEVEAGSTVLLLLTPPSTSVADVCARLRPSSKGAAVVSSDAFPTLSFRLSGLALGAPFVASEREWSPLVCLRWYELKNYVREATVFDRPESVPCIHGRPIAGEEYYSMYQGDVKAARALSTNNRFVRWEDGSIGPLDELKPFYREYTAARPEKIIRVRRFPHRHADVVGEVPAGVVLQACGRETDPFTKEHYALVYLPTDAALAHHISTYDLTLANGRYLWGWTKITGRSGLPLLVEAHNDGGSPSMLRLEGAKSVPAAATHAPQQQQQQQLPTSTDLPERTFYTSVRDAKVVRIRKHPTLKAPVIGSLEPNEVKEAVRLWQIPTMTASKPTTSTDDSHCHGSEFVEWKDGGFSLIKNAEQTFLSPVNITGTIRRFPLRARQAPAAADEDADEVLDLDALKRARKRQRQSAPLDSSDGDFSVMTDSDSEESV